MKVIRLSILIMMLVLFTAACGGAATPEPVTIPIGMTEYAFNPSTLDLKVGQQVTLDVTNNGQLVHELMFGREVMEADGRPAGYQEDMFAAGGVEPQVNVIEEGQMGEEMEEEEEHAGFMLVLGVGGHATMSFTVTEGMVGEWEMGCFELDGVHYDAGMHGPVTVTR